MDHRIWEKGANRSQETTKSEKKERAVRKRLESMRKRSEPRESQRHEQRSESCEKGWSIYQKIGLEHVRKGSEPFERGLDKVRRRSEPREVE